ncbi:hypothetical protein [Aeromonas sp. Y311-2]|jgi:hypothetical protein|uniref:hypothetical protein n=1 Tax=Aeromonas sp. Y311-2 TaxID=2990507 RepID=UPI0022E889B3|nr:hypothetical protein [Aeromonas sp. Y311-2]
MFFRVNPGGVDAVWNEVLAALGAEGVNIMPSTVQGDAPYSCNLICGSLPYRGTFDRVTPEEAVLVLLLSLYGGYGLIDGENRYFPDLSLAEQVDILMSLDLHGEHQKIQEAIKKILSKRKGLFEIDFF